MINLAALEVTMHAFCSASDLGLASAMYVMWLITGTFHARLIQCPMNACAQLSATWPVHPCSTLFVSCVIMTMRTIWETQESNSLNVHPVLHAT